MNKVIPRILAVLSISCGVYFLTVLFVMHFLRSDLDPYSTAVSYYFLTESSMYLSVGFCLAGIAECVMAVLLIFAFRNVSGFGRLMVLFAGFGLTMLSAERVGTMHLMGAVFQAVFFPCGLLMLGDVMERGFYKRFTQFVGSATLTLLPLMCIGFIGSSPLRPYFGLLEKMTIVVSMIWSWAVLVKTACRPESPQNFLFP